MSDIQAILLTLLIGGVLFGIVAGLGSLMFWALMETINEWMNNGKN